MCSLREKGAGLCTVLVRMARQDSSKNAAKTANRQFLRFSKSFTRVPWTSFFSATAKGHHQEVEELRERADGGSDVGHGGPEEGVLGAIMLDA